MSVYVELDESGTSMLVRAPARYKELTSGIPGSYWSAKDSIWRIPVSWSGSLALRSTYRDELEVGPKLKEWMKNEYETRVLPSFQLKDFEGVEDETSDLYPHQVAGVAFLATARRAILADEPGLGKTAQAIRAVAEIYRSGENPFPVLVVSPNTIKTNWQREFAKWWPGIRVQVINGTATERRKQFDTWYKAEDDSTKPHVFVINWESLRTHSRLASFGNIALVSCTEHGGIDEKISATRCEKHPKELNGIEFGAVIADEIHRAKDPRSKQSRALQAASGNADVRFALTGTPIAESVVDLWAILHWLNEKEWPTKTKWMDRMVDSVENMFGGIHVTGIKPHMKDEFFASTDPRIRRMLKKAVLKFLPPVINEERYVEMSAKQKKAYKDMKKHMIAEVGGGVALATSHLVQIARLLMFTVAYAEVVYNEKTGEEEIKMSEPSATLDAIMDDITSGDFGDDSIAISAGGPGSKQILNLLSARLEKAGIRHGMITGDLSADIRQKSIDEFQSGEVKYILYTVQAGGVGVTLTKARRLLRVMRPFSLVDDIQANDRVHRIGSEQHDSIIITDYIVADTVQQRVQEILNEKAEQAEEVMRDQRKILRLIEEGL